MTPGFKNLSIIRKLAINSDFWDEISGYQQRNLARLAILLGLIAMMAGEIFLLLKEKYLYALILLAFPLLLMSLIWLFKNLEYTVIVILVTAAFVPFSIPTGRGSPLVASLVLSIVLVAYWMVKIVVVDKKLSLIPSPVNAPALGFIVVTLFSIGWSTLLRDPGIYTSNSFLFVQLGAASVMVVSPAVSLMGANFMKNIQLIRMMVIIMLVVGVFGLVEYYANVKLYVNVGGLTSMWVIALCAGMVMFQDNLPKLWRFALSLLAGLWVVWNFFMHISWIAGWLPGFIALGVITFFRSKRLLLALIVIVVSYYFINQAVFAKDISNERVESGQTRFYAWQVNWSITKDHLLFGTGPAGYAAYYMSLFPTNAMATHSNYIDIIAETGIVGTSFYFWMFSALMWRGWKVTQRLKGKRDFKEALAVSIVAGVVGCIVIMAFGDWLLPFAYTQTIAGYSYTVYSWLFFGALLALDHITSEPQSKEGDLPGPA